MSNNALQALMPIPAMSDTAIDKVRQVETMAAQLPQIELEMQHVLHAGMYARTVRIPPGVMITGVLIKIPTLLIAQGDMVVYVGEEMRELSGYSILPASAMRKQAFVAQSEVFLTMVFPTDAKNVRDAEDEFTDEADLLMTRKGAA